MLRAFINYIQGASIKYIPAEITQSKQLSYTPRVSLYDDRAALKDLFGRLISACTQIKGSHKQINPVRLFVVTNVVRTQPTIASERVKGSKSIPKITTVDPQLVKTQKDAIKTRWICGDRRHEAQGDACYINLRGVHFALSDRLISDWATCIVK
jgi:hypothetical protein